jgi:hypothetical protein
MAALSLTGGDEGIKFLYSRYTGVHCRDVPYNETSTLRLCTSGMFGGAELAVFFCFYFVLALWSAGTTSRLVFVSASASASN